MTVCEVHCASYRSGAVLCCACSVGDCNLRSAAAVCCWHLLLHAAALCLTEGRVLKQDPASMVNVRGDQPAGMWAVTGHDAEAGAASAAKGVRYNEGKILVAGEGAPGPLALGIASSTQTASGEVCAPPLFHIRLSHLSS